MSIFKNAANFNVLILFGPAILATTIALTVRFILFVSSTSPLCRYGILGLFIGWMVLLFSKWPQIKTGNWHTFGISANHKQMKKLYFTGYLLIMTGSAFILISGFI